jgi:hypothetical protein
VRRNAKRKRRNEMRRRDRLRRSMRLDQRRYSWASIEVMIAQGALFGYDSITFGRSGPLG